MVRWTVKLNRTLAEIWIQFEISDGYSIRWIGISSWRCLFVIIISLFDWKICSGWEYTYIEYKLGWSTLWQWNQIAFNQERLQLPWETTIFRNRVLDSKMYGIVWITSDDLDSIVFNPVCGFFSCRILCMIVNGGYLGWNQYFYDSNLFASWYSCI